MSAGTYKPSILFVCLGNICRSPTAQCVFEQQLTQSDLAGKVLVDSAGTAAYHLGQSPDRRAQSFAIKRGIDLSSLKARQVLTCDFYTFDWILAMDQQNLADLETIRPKDATAKLALFLSFLPDSTEKEVPDPYYGGDEGFDTVLDLCDAASQALLHRLEQEIAI